MTEGTRSNLWVQMREAIAALRPRLVVWENVRGALSAPADSALEPCPGCVGNPDDGPVLRALGRVVGDLAELGYVGSWHGLRAADVGAPHGRFRVFLFAVPADSTGDAWRVGDGDGGAAADADGWRLEDGAQLNRHSAQAAADRDSRGPHADGHPGAEGLTLLPTPMTVNRTSDKAQTGRPTSGPTRGGPSYGLEDVVALLPTPVLNDMGEGKTVEHWDAWTATMQAKHGNGNGHGKSLAIEAQRLLPTPAARDWKDHQVEVAKHRPDDVDTINRALAHPERWGDYAAAIARWESVLGRPAPEPTEPGPKGSPRLSARFVEFLMGLPEGHVTGTGLTRNEALKALGNGVVPQQAAAATRWWLAQVAGTTKAVAS